MLLKLRLIVIVLFLFSFSIGQSQTASIRIIYLNNVDGYLRACHCPGNLFGGLLYAVGVVNNLRKENPNTLFVDAGDLFPGKAWKPKARYAIEFYNYMNVDAVNVGDQEFWFGVPYLQHLAHLSHFPFISLNLRYKNKPLFKPYIIKEIAGIKIGIIGFLDKGTLGLIDSTKLEYVKVLNYRPELRKTIATLKQQNVPVIILLSHCGLEKDKEIAKEFPNINFIIGAHSEKLLQKPVVVGKTAIFQAEHYAHYLGVLDVLASKDGVQAYENKVIKLESVPVTQEAAKIYQEYLNASDALVDSLSKVVHKSAKNYVTAPSSAKCGSCHFDEYDQWSRTPHAFAWETIAKEGRTKDVSCISCHTTLYRKNGGFVDMEITPELVNVGCVSCHRDYEGHPVQKKSMEPVKEATCKECHDKPNSPDFNFQTYREAVLHELNYYVVKKGDWLSKLAQRFYKNSSRWPTIYRANHADIKNPNLIFPNEKIFIPKIPANKIK